MPLDTGNFDTPRKEPEIPNSSHIVVFCTSPDGRKGKALIETARKIPGCAVAAVITPHSVPESLYNGSFDRTAGLIAASKVLQVYAGYPKNVESCCTDENLKKRISFGERLYIIANDIILDLSCDGNTNWMTFNKPDPSLSTKQIKDSLYAVLSPNRCKAGYIEARIRCGVAAFEGHSQRGILGTRESYFWIRPFSKEEIDAYVERNNGNLHNTNGSCRWEDELFRKHIVWIDGVICESAEFPAIEQRFLRLIAGGDPDLEDVLCQAENFSKVNVPGRLTSDVNLINQDYLHVPVSGSWGVYHSNMNRL